MYFKIDVSDRETGEIATLEVEAPTARAARQYLKGAGYMIWATQPSAGVSQGSPNGSLQNMDVRAEAAAHAGFFRHPVRFVLSPACRLTGGFLLWSAAAMLVLHPTLPPLPLEIPCTPSTAARLGLLLWTFGTWIGWPISRGRRAVRQMADAQLVCRYCRRRGQVRTSTRWWSGRLWGGCGICGLRWPL
jgi:hypothetical protein